MSIADLHAEIVEYSRRAGLSPSTLCLRAVGNGHLPKRLESGGGCNVRTMERIRAYMAENPPGDRKAASSPDREADAA